MTHAGPVKNALITLNSYDYCETKKMITSGCLCLVHVKAS